MNKNSMFLLCFIILSTLFFSPKSAFATDTYSNWVQSTPLPYNSSGNQSFVFGTKIYNFGGGDSITYHREIYSSNISADGSISSWVNRGLLPITVTWHSIVNRGNDVFLLGGAKPDPSIPVVSSIDTVYSSKIDSNGDVAGWVQQYSLPQKLSRGGTFVYQNRIYFVGGLVHTNSSSENVVSTVYFANIASDGTISNWIQTNSLPQSRAEFAIFNQGNTVYIIGGMQSNTQPSNTIYKGLIDDNTGQITWSLDSNIPIGLRRPAYAMRGNTVYLIGGYDGSNFTTTTYYSTISNGAFTSWNTLNIFLPGGSCCNSAVASQKSLYLIGRHDGVSYFSNVLRSDISTSLPVPNLKQYSPPWGNLEYDTAHIWSPGKDTISRYGCALTSATMILQHYGYTVSPDSLNTWLLNNHGYVKDGLVDFSAITKWVKLNHDINPLLPKLEYGRKKFNNTILDDELNAERPALVKLVRPDGGTHFVVATGKETNDYDINDPATTNSLLSFYPITQYARIDTLTPSNTDLSYLYFYTSPNVQFTVTGPSGLPILDNFEFEGPYIDQVNQTTSNQGILRSFAFPKPSQGEYTVRINGNGNYFAETRIYSNNGELTNMISNNTIETGKTITYIVNVSDTSQSKSVNFDFVRQSLRNAYQTGLIKSRVVYNSLIITLNTAERIYEKDKTKPAINILNAMKVEVIIAKKQIESKYAQKLTTYIGYLRESL